MNSFIFSSKGRCREVFLFLLKLFAFCGFLYGVPFVLFLHSGELMSSEAVVEKFLSANDNFLFATRYHNHNLRFKLQMIEKIRPDILVTGNSLGMEFRDFFFKEEFSFYNAAKAVDQLQAVVLMLDDFPKDYHPKYMIMAFDHRWFQKEILTFSDDYSYWDHKKSVSPLLQTIKITPTILNEIITGTTDFSDIKTYLIDNGEGERLGCDARSLGGYRRDGSFNYWRVLKYGSFDNNVYWDYQFNSTQHSMRTGERIVFDEPVHEKGLEALDAILNYCKDNDVQFIGYLSPFAPKVWKEAEKQSTTGKDFIRELPIALTERFKQYGFEFYDFSDGKTLDAPNAEFIDGAHASEKISLRILLKMAEEGKVIQNILDVENGKASLRDSKKSHFEIVHSEKMVRANQ